jgi:hypothetical protein
MSASLKPTSADDIGPLRLLTGLFVRRLLDNDLISPHADRHDSLAGVVGIVVSLAVFVTFFISTTYLSSFIQLPGPAALMALSDRFLFVAASMGVCALVALMVWDGLALEPRDALILGPLPISTRTIAHAKLGAAMLFGIAFAVAFNAVPSVLYPTFLTLNIRGVSAGGVLRLIAGQAATVTMAGIFGFCAILAIRGLLQIVCSGRGFKRLSNVIQSALVLSCVAAVLLVPTVKAADVRGWLAQSEPVPSPAVPVMWFVGLNEAIGGEVVADAPIVLPPRLPRIPFMMRVQDDSAKSVYQKLQARFDALAQDAMRGLLWCVGLAVACFLWNSRRLPKESTGVPSQSAALLRLWRILERVGAHHPERQAGFVFALQTIIRSAPHRMIAAVSVAAAATLPFVTLVTVETYSSGVNASLPIGLYGVQSMVLLLLIAGFRYAITVPAELKSNWMIQLAWNGDDREYLLGVKLAAVLVVLTLPLLVLTPLHLVLLGPVKGLVHSLWGFVLGLTVLELAFLGYRRFPFACTYVPAENMKLLWAAGFVSFLAVTYGFASLERQALQSSTGTAALSAALGVALFTVNATDRTQRREKAIVNFNEKPAPPTQRLGLFERLATDD